MATKQKLKPFPRPLKPQDPIRVRGVDVIVLEIKNNRVKVQTIDGTKFTAPLSECEQFPQGRPTKLNKEEYGQITCVLPLLEIERLKDGAGSKHFGEFLAHHLRRYPLPSREQYLALRMSMPYFTQVKRKKRVPTMMATQGLSKEAKKQAKEQARRHRLSPEARAWEDKIKAAVTRTVEATYAGNNA